jgi:hypothetical protein
LADAVLHDPALRHHQSVEFSIPAAATRIAMTAGGAAMLARRSPQNGLI